MEIEMDADGWYSRNVGGKKYKLNIHEHTQRLDNDTAGNLKGTKKSFKEIKNSQF